jgi:hypothetical protein
MFFFTPDSCKKKRLDVPILELYPSSFFADLRFGADNLCNIKYVPVPVYQYKFFFFLVLATLESLHPAALCDMSLPDPLSPPRYSDSCPPICDTSPLDLNLTRPDCYRGELFPPACSLERLRAAYPKADRLARHLTDLGPFVEKLRPLPWPTWSCQKPDGATDIFDLELTNVQALEPFTADELNQMRNKAKGDVAMPALIQNVSQKSLYQRCGLRCRCRNQSEIFSGPLWLKKCTRTGMQLAVSALSNRGTLRTTEQKNLLWLIEKKKLDFRNLIIPLSKLLLLMKEPILKILLTYEIM